MADALRFLLREKASLSVLLLLFGCRSDEPGWASFSFCFLTLCDFLLGVPAPSSRLLFFFDLDPEEPSSFRLLGDFSDFLRRDFLPDVDVPEGLVFEATTFSDKNPSSSTTRSGVSLLVLSPSSSNSGHPFSSVMPQSMSLLLTLDFELLLLGFRLLLALPLALALPLPPPPLPLPLPILFVPGVLLPEVFFCFFSFELLLFIDDSGDIIGEFGAGCVPKPLDSSLLMAIW
mmetsp:Transcript_18574/g.51849  ORF Transcript_18574/g.51849 Transcript_18574/m.51849 type:complete len:231 (-) Transcript_18574:950-1642(-)